MKHDKYNKSELFFKNLASSYAEKSGNDSKKDLDYLQAADVSSLDEKVKSKIRTHKVKKWTSRLMPIAACLIIFMTYIVISVNMPVVNSPNNFDNAIDYPNNAIEQSEISDETLTYEFVSTKLPSDYTLRKIDYDYHKVIYYIINSEGIEIILSIEEYTGNINTDGLDKIKIKNLDVYGISKEDFSFIQYKKDNFLYILTSPNDYDDLIKISECLI